MGIQEMQISSILGIVATLLSALTLAVLSPIVQSSKLEPVTMKLKSRNKSELGILFNILLFNNILLFHMTSVKYKILRFITTPL